MSLPAAPISRRRPGLMRQFPEPARFWITYSPRAWRLAGRPWTDVARGRLQALGESTADVESCLPNLDASDLDGVLYLPPVAAERRIARDLWAAELIETGTTILLGLRPGESLSVAGASAVYDLLSPLLAGESDRLSQLPVGATAVWPLVAGLTDSPETWKQGCETLATAGARCVQPLSVELEPEDRRHLVELGGERTFDAIFHGSMPSEREFSRCAASHGLEVFAPRLVAHGSARQTRNRHLATHLALTGELWLRLGRSVIGGQALIRAARGAEATGRDLTALAHEGNLKVLDWLDQESLKLIRDVLENGSSSLFESLRDEYFR